jgi:hypothetical protein
LERRMLLQQGGCCVVKADVTPPKRMLLHQGGCYLTKAYVTSPRRTLPHQGECNFIKADFTSSRRMVQNLTKADVTSSGLIFLIFLRQGGCHCIKTCIVKACISSHYIHYLNKGNMDSQPREIQVILMDLKLTGCTKAGPRSGG